MFQIYEILERIYALRALEKTRQSKMIFREREREGAREREREKGKHGQMPVWVAKNFRIMIKGMSYRCVLFVNFTI